jgi:uncharacterized protein YajQ (UPF0234 family)
MAKDNSFDVVSKVDYTLVKESIQVALKEVTNRYDFRGVETKMDFNEKEHTIILSSGDDYKVQALFDILVTRMAKRGLPVKNFQPEKMEEALGGTARQKVTITQGIPTAKAKEITKALKEEKLKVQATNQGDYLRIASKSRDLLQETQSFLKEKDWGIDLQFENYR